MHRNNTIFSRGVSKTKGNFGKRFTTTFNQHKHFPLQTHMMSNYSKCSKKREFEEEREKDRKHKEKHTYSYQLLGSSSAHKEKAQDRGRVKTCQTHAHPLKSPDLRGPSPQVGLLVIRLLSSWVRRERSPASIVP